MPWWDADRMRWYGPSGIGTSCGMTEYRANHAYPFRHGLPKYGVIYAGKHIADIGEGMYAGWVGWPSIRAHLGGEDLGGPPNGKVGEWRLMDFYRRGKLHLDDFVSAHIRLAQINEGCANMKAGKVVRSVIDFGVVKAKP